MSRPRGRMPRERRWAMGKIGKGEHSSTRFGARTRMFEADFGRSHGWRRPKAHRRVPLDKRVSRRYPTSVGRISGGEDLWCDLPKRAGLSKVTRPGPKGGRNSVEGEASCPMRCSRIKGPTAGSGIRRESVVVEQTISCGAMRCAYCTLRCSTAWQSHAIRGIRRIWAFGLTPPGSRASEYAALFESTGTHHIDNLREILIALTLTLSRRERGQRYRKQKR